MFATKYDYNYGIRILVTLFWYPYSGIRYSVICILVSVLWYPYSGIRILK